MNNDIDSIDGVLEALDLIIRQSAAANNPLGYFAYIYRRTTAQIKTGIETNRFENSKRMELFDIKFARYYLDAYHNFSEQEPVSQSWKTCFEAKDEDLIIVQHLMMGMNAHINARHLFVIRVPVRDMAIERNELLLELRARNIGASIHYAPLHTLPLYQPYVRGNLSNVEALMKDIMTLPIGARVSTEDGNYVADQLLAALEGARSS